MTATHDLSMTKKESNEKKKHSFFDSWAFIILVCVVMPLAFRSFAWAPFHIPSGSMKPTLLVGDFIFVSKFEYGYSRYSFPFSPNLFDGRVLEKAPERGDIIVFRPPPTPNIDYIKRLIGLPGDKIQVINGRLYINNVRVSQERVEDFVEEKPDGSVVRIKQFVETLPNGVSYRILDETPYGKLDNTIVYTVPEGHYFMMGDNRDNSQDSRVLNHVGFVPASHLVGKANLIFISTESHLWKIWEWPNAMRTERFFQSLNS